MEEPGNDGWVLCQSKSFNGTYYYFNVRTGESRWGPDNGIQQPRRREPSMGLFNPFRATAPIQHPNPFNPKPSRHPFSYPPQYMPYNPNYTSPFFTHNQPVFGKKNVSFPQYLTRHEPRTNPFSFKTSTKRVASHSVQTEPTSPKQDMVTQTEDDFQVQLTHTSTPLCMRFSGKKKLVDEPFTKTSNVKKFKSSEEQLDSGLSTKQCNLFSDIAREHTSKDESESVCTAKADKVISHNSNPQEDISNLCENDLRFVLLRKMGKLNHIASQTSTEDRSHVNMPVTQDKRFVVKPPSLFHAVKSTSVKPADKTTAASINKRVSFNIRETDISSPVDCRNEDTPSYHSEGENVATDVYSVLDRLASVSLCLAPDLDTCLNEHLFLTQYLTSDPASRLLVPYSIRRHLQALGKGLSEGRPEVLAARRALRMMGAAGDRVAVPAEEDAVEDMDRSLVSCCQKAAETSHVILLTNKTHIKDMTRATQIICMDVQDFKQHLQTHSNANKVQFDPQDLRLPSKVDAKTIKVTIKTDQKRVKVIEPRRQESNLVSDFCNMSISTTDDMPIPRFRSYGPTEDLPIPRSRSFGTTDDLPMPRSRSFVTTNDLPIPRSRSFGTTNDLPIPRSRSFGPTNDLPIPRSRSFGTTDDLPIPRSRSFVQPAFSSPSNSVEMGLYFSPRKDDAKIDRLIKESQKGFPVDPISRSRMEEWVCVFVQTMDDCLENALGDNYTAESIYPPYTLLRGVKRLSEMFADNNKVKSVCKSLVGLLYLAGHNGAVTVDISYSVFVKILGTSALLVRVLRESLSLEALDSAQQQLSALAAALGEAPGAEGGAPGAEGGAPGAEDGAPLPRTDTPKREAVQKPEVLDYLRKHYPIWREMEEDNKTKASADFASCKIIRTVGRDANQLTIRNDKNITLNTGTTLRASKDKEDKTSDGKSVDRESIVKSVDKESIVKSIDKDSIVKSVDRESIVKSVDRESIVKSVDRESIVKSVDRESIVKSVDRDSIVKSDSSRDSGVVTSVGVAQATTLARQFLCEFKATFLAAYEFVDASLLEYTSGEVPTRRQRDIRTEAGRHLAHLCAVRSGLHRILEREISSDASLKMLLIRTAYHCEDVRLSRYKQVISKCTEQVDLLETSLKTLEALGGAAERPALAVLRASDALYSNIFET